MEVPQPTENYFLAYASTAVRQITAQDLLDVLTKARATNSRLGVTGLLLFSPGGYKDAGTFFQVLEGEKALVDELYGHIVRDPLHTNCTVVRSGLQVKRRFGDWTMGFRNLAEVDVTKLSGYNPIFQSPWTLARILAEPDPVLQMVYSFAGES